MTASEYWFGNYGDRALLYDPSFQIEGYPYVFLWNTDSGRMETFPRERARGIMVKDTETADRSETIRRYMTWKLAESATFMEEAQKEYGTLRQALANQAQRASRDAGLAADRELNHQRYMEELGLRYQGIRRVTRPRSATCYRCSTFLDNSVEVECAACGWIVCCCGACGCGYSSAITEPR